MSRNFLVVFLVLGALSAISLNLAHRYEVLADMYERDVALSYQAGVRYGIQEAIDSGKTNVEALSLLYGHYPKADPDNYAVWTFESSLRWGVPALAVAGIVMQESSCDAEAVSSCGAVGLTQIRWDCWGKELVRAGIMEKESDRKDPQKSIEGCAYILSILIEHHGSLDEALKYYSGNARGYPEKVFRRVTG